MSAILFKKYFKKYWVLENKTNFLKPLLPMIPDGNLELLLVVGNGFSIKTKDSESTHGQGIYLGGQLSGLTKMKLLPNTRIHILKLEAATIPMISSFKISEILDKVVPFEVINKELYLKLKDVFHEPRGIKTCVLCFLKYLESGNRRSNNSDFIQYSSWYLQQNSEDFTTLKKHILQDSKITAKTLENNFKNYVGLTPKTYSNVIKLRRCIEHLTYYGFNGNLTEIALEKGYYDQSHFIREFRALFEKAPTQLDFDNYFIPNSKEYFRYYTIN